MRYLGNVCCVLMFMVARNATIRAALCVMTAEHQEMEDVDEIIIHNYTWLYYLLSLSVSLE